MEDILDYGRRLRCLRDEYAGSDALLLGFPGAGGGFLPNGLPPPALFYCPGVILLHDVVWVPDHVFELDGDETRATVPYLLLDELSRDGVVRFVPCADEPGAREFGRDVFDESLEIASSLLAGSALGDPSPDVIRQVVLQRHVPSGSTAEEWREPSRLFRAVFDAVFVHGLAEVLQCPLGVANDDFSIHAARHYLHGGDPESLAACCLEVPVPRGSILVDDAGEAADLVPEAVLIPQRVLQGSITVREMDGTERPYRGPDGPRSVGEIERLLSARKRDEFIELRRILRGWYDDAATSSASREDLRRLSRDYQERIDRLTPSLRSASCELGGSGTMLSLSSLEPGSSRTSRRLSDPPLSDTLVAHLQDYGAVPAFAAARVLRRRV